MADQNPYAPPRAVVADVVGSGIAPELWNPNAAASWSLLFTPIFGAYLHMRNWEALGVPDKAAKSKYWYIASIVFLVVVFVFSFLAPESQAVDSLGRLGGFALLLAWYFSLGKSQSAYVKERFGDDYPRRSWTKPLLTAFGIFFGIIALFVILFLAVASTFQ